MSFKSHLKSLFTSQSINILSVAFLFGFTVSNAEDLNIYSHDQLLVGAYAIVNAGSVQSATDVLVDNYAQIKGSVYSSGTALVRSGSHVYSNLFTGSTYSIESGAIVDGVKQANASVPAYSLNTKTVVPGTVNKTVAAYGTLTLSAGSYQDVFVGQGGTLNLSAGTYNFRKLEVYYDAKVFINITANQAITLNIRDFFAVRDRAKISLTNATNTNAVNFYVNQSGFVDIGSDANVEGCFDVPNGEFRILARAYFTGSVNAKKVSVLAQANINGELARDRDADGAPDVIEYLAGTSPTNAADKPATLKTGSWANITEYGNQKVAYNFSGFTGYELCDSIPVSFPKSNLSGPYTLIYTPKNYGSSGITLPDPKYKSDVTGFAVRVSSNCYSCFQTQIPLSKNLRGTPKVALKLYYKPFGTSTWNEIPIQQVNFGTVVTMIPGAGTYVVAKYTNTYQISKDFTTGDLKTTTNKLTIQEALTALNSTGGIILVAKANDGSEYIPTISYSIPGNIRMYGGFPSRFSGGTMVSNQSLPFVNVTKLKAANLTDPIMVLQNSNVEINGFVFQGNISETGVTTKVGGLVITGDVDAPISNIKITNCNFKQNVGTIAGAAFLQSARKVFFTSCAFYKNISIGTEATCLPRGGCAIISGSAVGIVHQSWHISETDKSNNPVEVEFYSCVFTKNNAKPGTAIASTGTITTTGYGDANCPTKFVSCTFYDNAVGSDYSAASVNHNSFYLGTSTTTTDEQIAAGAAGGTTKDYSGTLANIPNSTFTATDGVEIFTVTDNSIEPAILTGDKGGTGTVSFSTGAWTLSFNTAVTENAPVKATYDFLLTASRADVPLVFMNTILRSDLSATPKEIVCSNVNDKVTYNIWNQATTKSLTIDRISYTNILQTGFVGTGNYNDADPGFVNASSPGGGSVYEIFGDGDDGLELSLSSKCRLRALPSGLQEYSDAAYPDYNRGNTDMKNITRLAYNTGTVLRIDGGAFEKVIKIMCVGDDNTVGWTETYDTDNNYRKQLKALLDAANIENEFVGSQEGGHEGVAGQTIDYFSGNIASIADVLNPNIIIFLGGTTDIAAGTTPSIVFDRLYKSNTSSFVYNIKNKLNENKRLIISLIPPVTKTTTTEKNFVDYNILLKDYTWSSINTNIQYVNPITTDIYNPAGSVIYPNTYQKMLLTLTGYSIFANEYFKAINLLYK